ncbi:Fc.00g084600.m01.CDS01 [Cosmosporella sp. VM-42]
MARRRAIDVCSACHERKIRCDLDKTTRPCSNCRERRSECTLRTRKPYRAINRNKKNGSVKSDETTSDSVDTSSSVSQIDQARIVASVIARPSSRTTSIYVGESGYGSILDMLRPGSPKRRHITVNGTADAALNAGDLEYLKLKGCFELPAQSEELLAAYFHFVHPIFPVLDGSSFLRDHARGGLDTMNLLLLWSMFSVSASYVPACSGKETKALFVMRGKVLFDISGENDKLVLIQSALLLSFWFDDAEDIKQSWYWSGIAFNIAQTLGLHRIPILDSQQISQTEYDIWKNLWHCCMLRDAWLSYSMGRPLRLNEAASSATLLLTADCRFRDMKFNKNNVYSEEEAEGFEKMWRSSVTAAHTLRQCQSLSSKPTQPSILAMCLRDSQQIQEDTNSGLLLSLCGRHLKLCQNAAMIAISQSGGDKEMAEAAAGETVTIIRSYLRDTTIAYVPPTVVPLIMPAMLISVSALKSGQLHIRELGESRLSCCFQLLDEIERTFPAASIVKQLFDAVYRAVRAEDHNFPDPN